MTRTRLQVSEGADRRLDQVTIWPDGTLGNRTGAGKESAIVEEDWICDGTLWLTKVKQPTLPTGLD